ncbi:hypothetical protein UCC_03068 [Enterococcus faecalis EnGen0238]|nr:hypothetical protein UCC_03068 [Enterococcus faecalis EnGen0238]
MRGALLTLSIAEALASTVIFYKSLKIATVLNGSTPERYVVAYLSFHCCYSTTTLKRPSIKNTRASYFSEARAFFFYGPVTKFHVTAAWYC